MTNIEKNKKLGRFKVYLNGGLSKQFTVVTTVILSSPNSWVLQFVGGSEPRLPKYLKSYSPGIKG